MFKKLRIVCKLHITYFKKTATRRSFFVLKITLALLKHLFILPYNNKLGFIWKNV